MDASTNIGEDYKAKSKLFVERIEDIISNHSSESRFQYPSAVNQIPSDYMISESGKTETTNGKKISFDSFTDKIKGNREVDQRRISKYRGKRDYRRRR
jgi:hypothetical protein